MDFFNEMLNLIYLAKQLKDIGMFHLIEDYQDYSLADDGELYYDIFYETAYQVVYGDLFDDTRPNYYESREFEIIVYRDTVISDYYRLAGEYARKNNQNDDTNPYIKAAEKEVNSNLNFSYNIDWLLKVYTDPKRVHRSRLALFLYTYDYIDLMGVAIGMVRIYKFFKDKCEELRTILGEITEQQDVQKEAIAA